MKDLRLGPLNPSLEIDGEDSGGWGRGGLGRNEAFQIVIKADAFGLAAKVIRQTDADALGLVDFFIEIGNEIEEWFPNLVAVADQSQHVFLFVVIGSSD